MQYIYSVTKLEVAMAHYSASYRRQLKIGKLSFHGQNKGHFGVGMCVCHILISAHAKGLSHGVSSCSIWLISVVISAFQKAHALKETKKKGVEYIVATS